MRISLAFVAVLAVLTFIASPSFACECEEAAKRNLDAAWCGEAIDAESLQAYSCADLRILRNTIYARHGYVFGNEWVKAQFQDDPRYQPDANVGEKTVGSMLTPNDLVNVKVVFAAESQYQCMSEDVPSTDRHEPVVKTVKEPAQEAEPVADSQMPVAQTARREFAKLSPERPVNGEFGFGTERFLSEAVPQFIVNEVLHGLVIENAWLVPLTCEELVRVAEAVSVVYDIPLPNREDEALFTRFWNYRPVPGLTLENTPMRSVHQLDLLRAQNAMDAKKCANK